MKLLISSGQGPAECELAASKFLERLRADYGGIDIVNFVSGTYAGTYKSVIISSPNDLSHFAGTVRWVCQSPYRPSHGRKNWFINVTVQEEKETTSFDEKLVRYETFVSGGKGGQHVNKTESGVRAHYAPLGISAISTDERSQHMNKKTAKERLRRLFQEMAENDAAKGRHSERGSHFQLERGNATLTFKGEKFEKV